VAHTVLVGPSADPTKLLVGNLHHPVKERKSVVRARADEDISMHRSTGRVFVTACLFAVAGLFAPAVLAQGEEAHDTCGSRSRSRTTGSSGPVVFIGGSRSASGPVASSPRIQARNQNRTSRRGRSSRLDVGTTGAARVVWARLARQPRTRWRLCQYSWAGAYVPESVYDSRGRFCPRPAAHPESRQRLLPARHRASGGLGSQIYDIYQINADDVYVQSANRTWDFMAGRFLNLARLSARAFGSTCTTLEVPGAL